MVTAVRTPQSGQPEAAARGTTGHVTVAVIAAGIATFALLYAPQAVLPQIATTFQLNAGTASLAVSVASAGLAIAVLPIATLSELVGRRRVMVTSLVVSVLLGLIIPFAPNYEVLLVLRGIQGAAIAGFPGVGAAFLVERLGALGVAGAVGAMVAGNTVGGMFGRLASGFTTEWLGWRLALACSAIVSLACAAVAIYALFRLGGVRWRAPSVLRSGRTGALVAGVGAAVRSRVLLAQYGVALLGMGAFVAMYNAAAFRLTERPLSLPPAMAALVFLAYATGAVSSALAGRFVARFGRVRSLVGALGVTVGGAVCTLSDALPLVVAGLTVLTAGFFAAHAVSSGWTASAALPGGRGQASGLYTLAYYIGASIGGTVGSVVYAHFGWGALIAMITGWLAFAVLGVLAVRRAQPRTPGATAQPGAPGQPPTPGATPPAVRRPRATSPA